MDTDHRQCAGRPFASRELPCRQLSSLEATSPAAPFASRPCRVRSCANGSRSAEARSPCVARVARLLSTLLVRLPCSRLQTLPTHTSSHRRPIYKRIPLPQELSQAEKRRKRMALLVEALSVDVTASAAQSRQSEQLRQCSSGPMPDPSSLHGKRRGLIRSGTASRS